MNYLIDGHNLIGKTPGISLSMPDDEQLLIELLVRYAGRRRHTLEVYFDGAPPGQAGMRLFGRVRAHFIPERQTADAAIRARLSKLGRSATNWCVVSSDRSVQAAAREAHSRVMNAEDFATLLAGSIQEKGEGDNAPDEPLSEAEVREWQAFFKKHGRQS